MGLRGRLTIILVCAVVGAGVLNGWIVEWRVRGEVTRELVARTEILNHALDASDAVASALAEDASADARAEGQAFLDKLVAADRELTYVMVVRGDLTNPEPVLWAPRDGVVGRFKLSRDKDRATLARDYFADKVHDNDHVLHRAVALLGADSNALLGMTPDVQLGRFRAVVTSVSLLSGVMLVGVLWWFFGRLSGRVNRLKSHADKIAAGELATLLDSRASDEFGEISRALDTIVRGLGRTIAQVRGSAFELDGISAEARQAARRIVADASSQAGAVQQTTITMEQLTRASSTLASQIQEVTHAAELSATRMGEISAGTGRIASAFDQVAAAVEQTSQHLDHNLASLGEVNRAVDRLSAAAEGTARATSQITANIGSVERASDEALTMSFEASSKAESGVEAVKGTLEGILRIRSFNNETLESIRLLSHKVVSIESILDVIDDIANQTRLLSLNASIIAAQAGEHGRSFLVVAEEIKALASKTAGSTREISQVIGEVLKVTDNVMAVASRGVSTVDDGVERSEHADEVLSSILVASHQTGAIVRAIASSMTEQARSTAHVNDAVQEVHQIVLKLRSVVASQTGESRELDASTHDMRDALSRAIATAREQGARVDQAISAMGAIFEQIKLIAGSNAVQLKSRADLGAVYEMLETLTQRQRESAGLLADNVERAARESESLTSAVGVFRA